MGYSRGQCLCDKNPFPVKPFKMNEFCYFFKITREKKISYLKKSRKGQLTFPLACVCPCSQNYWLLHNCFLTDNLNVNVKNGWIHLICFLSLISWSTSSLCLFLFQIVLKLCVLKISKKSIVILCFKIYQLVNVKLLLIKETNSSFIIKGIFLTYSHKKKNSSLESEIYK